MGIENGGDFRKVEEAEELAEGSGVEQKVTPEQVEEGRLKVVEESHPKGVTQEQQVEQEAIPELSPQLLQIGPDFDENWVSYDTEDRAILRLDKGDIEELKTELQEDLESGQITLSNGELKRLDIPEEQKEIKKKLQTIESTIQALIQSNDNLPRDLRETLQQEMRNDNAGKSLDDEIQGRIEFIGERRRFKFFGIGQEEIQALESLRESIKAEFTKYSQLQNSEQDIVDRDIIIKFQQLPKSIQQSIYSLENPTVENINEVIEAISSYKTPQELIEKRQEIRDYVARELRYLLQDMAPYRAMGILQEKLGISEEILQEAMQDEKVRAEVKEVISYKLHHIDKQIIDDIEQIIEVFNVSDEKVQEAVKEAVVKQIISYLGDGNIDSAKEIIEKFGMSEYRVQEAVKVSIVFRLKNPDIIFQGVEIVTYVEEIIEEFKEFGINMDSLKVDKKVQAAAEEAIIDNLCLGNSRIIDEAKQIIEVFDISEEIIKSTKIQEAAKKGIIYNLYSGKIDEAIKIKEEKIFGVSEETIKSLEVQKAVEKAIISQLNEDNTDEAIRIGKVFSVSDEIFQEIKTRVELINKDFSGENTTVEKRQEIKEFTRSYSSVERINKARELREIPKNERKNELDNFYKEQELIMSEFLETIDERQVEDIMHQYNVIFTHGIALDFIKSTVQNNTVIDIEKVKPETKVKLVLGFQPTISACVTKISEQSPNAHYYKFGLMIGSGTVMIAHNRDTATITENMYSRRVKDGEKHSISETSGSYQSGKFGRKHSFFPKDMETHNIQMNISEHIRDAIEDPIGVGSARNEVIIENPDAIGIYIDFNNQISEAELIQITKIARDVNLPIFGLRNGQIFYLQGTGKTEVNLSELHVSKNLTKRQRLEYIDDAIQGNIFQNGQIAIEVTKRISLLKSQIKETPEMEQEISTQQESEDFYPDFKYLDSYHRIFYNADLILKGEHSRVKAIPEGGDDIINFFSDMGVSQEHMRKIRSIFENKSLPECRELIDNFLHQFNEAKEMLSKWKQSQIETQQITESLPQNMI